MPEFASIDCYRVLGKFNAFGVTGVSASALGNSGFSINGKFGSCR